MRTFTIVRTDYPMEVHAAGCRDIRRNATPEEIREPWNITGETVEEAVEREAAELNSQFDNVYPTEELFRILPCARRH